MVRDVPPGSFILLEDVDSCVASADRSVTATRAQETKPTVSLSTLLNTLDGIGGVTSSMVFVTTNYIEKLDAALTRAGRMDYCIEFKLLDDEQIKGFIRYSFPNQEIDVTARYEPIAGCDIQRLLIKHFDDYRGFESNLKKDLLKTIKQVYHLSE